MIAEYFRSTATFLVPPLTVFSIVKVAIFLMPTGTLRKIMTFLRNITVCSRLMPPLENKLRLKYSKHPRINTTHSCSLITVCSRLQPPLGNKLRLKLIEVYTHCFNLRGNSPVVRCPMIR